MYRRIVSVTIGLVCVYSFLVFPVFAQSTQGDSFVITQQIGIDTQAPTVPSGVTASAVATTQIDISWNASTDNVGVSGYRLFRDGIPIATTTLTTYADTGLSPGTSYTYFVQAFDAALNISSSSATATATTLTPSVASSSLTSATAGTAELVRLKDLTIVSDVDSATFSWSTNVYTRYVLRWGKMPDYELGSVWGDLYKQVHKTVIADLEQDTTYFYELRAYNRFDRAFVLSQGTFTTTVLPDTQAPANVTNVRVMPQRNSVLLQWRNPPDSDFAKVRIVRNHLFYPEDPLDGFVLYEGASERFLDTNALTQYPGAYYTIFSYDTSDNRSSGAIAYAARTTSESQYPPDDSTGGTVDITDRTDSTSTSTFSLDFNDIIFIQGGVVLPHTGQEVTIESKKPLQIQMPYALLPRHLKTITISLESTNGKRNEYLLRSNGEKTAYEAVIQGLAEGTYTVTFSIYDYKTQLRTRFAGTLNARPWVSNAAAGTTPLDIIQSIQRRTGTQVAAQSMLWLFVVLLLWWYVLLLRRRTEDN